jgi:antitoxin MazE
MELQVSKWGNSLAVRLPAPMAKNLGVYDGAYLQAEVLGTGHLRFQAADQPMNRARFITTLRNMHQQTVPTLAISKDELSRY